MKKIYTLVLLLFSIHLQAQTNFTSANEAAVGNTFNYFYVDSSTANPGPAGANQTWNYSSVVPNGLIHTDNWVAPSSTPYASSFPGTNLVQQTTDTAGNTVYLYHTTSSSQTELNGLAFTTTATVIFSYSNSHILRQFPSTYNTTFTDNFAGMFSISQGPLTINNYRYGNYTYTIDGYGTLITPIATYTNALRLKINQHITDSMVYVGIPLPGTLTYNNSLSYFYGSTNAGNKLYQFYIGYDTSITSTSTIITKAASYYDGPSAIEENSPHASSIAPAFPNPANDYSFITLDSTPAGTAELILYDVRGRAVKSMTGRLRPVNHFEWMFSVSDLPAGLYHARITCGDKQWQAKIVKQ